MSNKETDQVVYVGYIQGPGSSILSNRGAIVDVY